MNEVSTEKAVAITVDVAKLHLSLSTGYSVESAAVAIRWKYPDLSDWQASKILESARSLVECMPKKK